MDRHNNLKEFKELIETYENLKEEDLTTAIDDPLTPFAKLLGITGFGSSDTCTLCIKARKIINDLDNKSSINMYIPMTRMCNVCIYELYTGKRCYNSVNMKTYEDVNHSLHTSETLLKAVKARVKHMRMILLHRDTQEVLDNISKFD